MAMKPTHLVPLFLIPLLAAPLTARDVPLGKPEDVGMSSERLRRIHEAIQRHIDTGEISGAVTLVARRGRMVHFEAHGLMDTESKRPMEKDAIFRIASMSKPITGVAVMMMLEEGKLRLNDPVSRFLPEFKDPKVAVPKGNSGQFGVLELGQKTRHRVEVSARVQGPQSGRSERKLRTVLRGPGRSGTHHPRPADSHERPLWGP